MVTESTGGRAMRGSHLGSFYTTDGCRQYTKWSEVRRSGQVASRWSRCSFCGLPTPVITARAAHQAPLLVRQQCPAVRATDAAVARRGVRGRRACRPYGGRRFGPEADLEPMEDVVDDAGCPADFRVAGGAVWLETRVAHLGGEFLERNAVLERNRGELGDGIGEAGHR